jgi:hypothetical protein
VAGAVVASFACHLERRKPVGVAWVWRKRIYWLQCYNILFFKSTFFSLPMAAPALIHRPLTLSPPKPGSCEKIKPMGEKTYLVVQGGINRRNLEKIGSIFVFLTKQFHCSIYQK